MEQLISKDTIQNSTNDDLLEAYNLVNDHLEFLNNNILSLESEIENTSEESA